MIDEIKRLKPGKKLTYHIGNFSYDSRKNPDVKTVHSFIQRTMYDINKIDGRIEPKKVCKYTIYQKKHYSGSFEYIIKRKK